MAVRILMRKFLINNSKMLNAHSPPELECQIFVKKKKSICVNITLSSKFHTDNIVVVNLHKKHRST